MATDPMLALHVVVQMALADAQRFGAEPLQLVLAKSVQWPGSALGCPEPNGAYTQALVPGFRVQVRVGQQLLYYRAARQGAPRPCPADRRRPPGDGSGHLTPDTP